MATPKISVIVAIANHNAIGKGNDLLCHVPGDLKRFKEITSGYAVIMGRKTFESLPKGPLPNRRNIVISSNKDLLIDGAEVVESPEKAIELCHNEEEVFIIGGGKIYSHFMPMADNFYLTRIYKEFDADTFFPNFDLSDWEIEEKTDFEPTDKNDFYFSFINCIKKIPS